MGLASDPYSPATFLIRAIQQTHTMPGWEGVERSFVQFLEFVIRFRFSKLMHAAYPQHVYCIVQVKSEVREGDVAIEVKDEEVDQATVKLEVKEEVREVKEENSEMKREVKDEEITQEELFQDCDHGLVNCKDEVQDESEEDITHPHVKEEIDGTEREHFNCKKEGTVKKEIKVKNERVEDGPRIKVERKDYSCVRLASKSKTKVKVKKERGTSAGVKCKKEVHDETSAGVKCKEEVHDDAGTKVKIEPKSELTAESSTPRSPPPRKLVNSASSFAARFPLWLQMCVDHQKNKRTWAPARPCCMPCLFLDPPVAPIRSELKPCYHRLSKTQKRKFRAWIECMTEESEAKFLTTGRMNDDIRRLWQAYVHPEKIPITKKTKNVTACKTGKPCRKAVDTREWPWEIRIEARRLWQGGWMLKPGGGDVGVQRINTGGDAGYIFTGVGQVKAPPKKRARPTDAGSSTDVPEQPTKRGKIVVHRDSGCKGVTWNDFSGQCLVLKMCSVSWIKQNHRGCMCCLLWKTKPLEAVP